MYWPARRSTEQGLRAAGDRLWVPQAKIGTPSTAALARAAGDPGSANDEISLRQIRDGSASGDHTPPQFVPGDHRSGVTCHRVAPVDRVLDRPVSVLVCISAADTGGVHLEHHLVGPGRRVRPRLYTDVGPAVINGRLQLRSPIPVRPAVPIPATPGSGSPIRSYRATTLSTPVCTSMPSVGLSD